MTLATDLVIATPLSVQDIEIDAPLDYDSLNTEPSDVVNFKRFLEIALESELLNQGSIDEAAYVMCTDSEYEDFGPEAVPLEDPWWY
jgi:hypothetical protein